MKTIVPDTSVVVSGRLVQMAKSGEIAGARIIIHQAVLAELEHQANEGMEIGFTGLSELRTLTELAEQGSIRFETTGERPTLAEVKGAPSGDIDAKIRKLAKEHKAALYTADRVQCEVAKAEGIPVVFFEQTKTERGLSFLGFFDGQTMSVHLKENTIPLAKRGGPGSVRLVRLSTAKSTREELLDIARETVEAARSLENSYIELDHKGATVAQVGHFRIAIARPPFSDGVEITIVKPIAKKALADYGLSEKLGQRLSESAEGIVICGSPGAGKSTFTAALAEDYESRGKIVKTMESPRDLQVKDEITQYAPLEGSFEKTSDILLLTRPDYTIFDEMRKTDDFKIYADLRLAGVGMVGVVHASRPIDAIQRFIGRIELGMIPQVVDTVVFIKGGRVEKALNLSFSVKVPTGMTEADLARPVIEVLDFETGKLEFEIYKFGDETVVFPVGAEATQKQAMPEALKNEIYGKLERAISHYARREFQIEFAGKKAVVHLHPSDIPSFIGKKGKNISKIERSVGVKIDVRELE